VAQDEREQACRHPACDVFPGGYYAEASRWDEAIKLANELLTLRREVNGPDATDTIFAMGSLAQYCLSAEHYAEACKLHEELLPLFRKQFGEKHPYTLDAMTKLAICYSSLERTDEALQLQEDALKMMKGGTMDPSEPIYAIALDHMAKLYDKTGRKDEAAKLQAEREELRE
jgi:tetratricopeptide (TPR) repeat protein